MPGWPIQQIRELLEPTLAHLGYELYAVEQTGPGRILRISIDKPAGVTLDDCERVSHIAGPILDQADLIDGGRYSLQVSSPGAERPLRERWEFERFAGKKVNVRYRYGENSEGVIEGVLAAVGDAGITVSTRSGELLEIAWPSVLAARLTVSL
ncbi:MAG: ribosome maturation factor RimP [Candidatus Dormibacteraceae bacterium]